MRILFVVNRMAHVRHFDRAIRLLADRGHDVILASQDDDVEVRGVLAQQPRITPMRGPRGRRDEWEKHVIILRRARDYVRYLHPQYRDAVLLRNRAFEKLVRAVAGPETDIPDGGSEVLLSANKGLRKRLNRLFEKLEATVPSDAEIDAFVLAQRADAIVLSPMVGVGFSQADFVKTARRLGIPSGMLVYSWDNLSNKSLIHEAPDRMWVWNDRQVHEAAELHGYPTDRVVVTGAPRFDEFFEMRPEIARDDLCGQLGLDPTRPILAYLCSSKFIAPNEQAFVRGWIRQLRRSPDPALAGCSVIVRPHPAGLKSWHAERQVVRWPHRAKASASRPFDDAHTVVMSSRMQNADQVLFDTIFHSAAVVGLNTSAEIEAAIVGRPVATLLDPGTAGQRETLHFRYLLRSEGGHVEIAESFDDHLRQLSDAIAGRTDRAAVDQFVRRFVRPHGLDAPVSPILADAIEALAAVPNPVPLGS